MVNTSSGWRQQRLGMAAQVQAQRPQSSEGVQDATTRTVACAVCKAVYTPAPAHQQLVMAPHIVLESAFMSMCHFCFRCRRTACPDCWDAVHGVCGACVKEAHLPFRTQVKPLSNIMPSLPQAVAEETADTASILICIQHGQFHADSPQITLPTPPSHSVAPIQMRRPMRVASPESGQRRTQQPTAMTRIAPEYPGHTAHTEHRERPALREEDETENEPEQPEQLEQAEKLEQPVSRLWGVTEQWLTGILLSLLLTIVTFIVIAEASPTANAQIMHLFNIDIRSEIAYLVHLMGQLQL